MIIKKVLKVKFCSSEEELNEFLKKLPLEEYPSKDDKLTQVTKLYRITYMPKQDAKGNTDAFEIGSSIISIVEYWDLEPTKE